MKNKISSWSAYAAAGQKIGNKKHRQFKFPKRPVKQKFYNRINFRSNKNSPLLKNIVKNLFFNNEWNITRLNGLNNINVSSANGLNKTNKINNKTNESSFILPSISSTKKADSKLQNLPLSLKKLFLALGIKGKLKT